MSSVIAPPSGSWLLLLLIDIFLESLQMVKKKRLVLDLCSLKVVFSTTIESWSFALHKIKKEITFDVTLHWFICFLCDNKNHAYVNACMKVSMADFLFHGYSNYYYDDYYNYFSLVILCIEKSSLVWLYLNRKCVISRNKCLDNVVIPFCTLWLQHDAFFLMVSSLFIIILAFLYLAFMWLDFALCLCTSLLWLFLHTYFMLWICSLNVPEVPYRFAVSLQLCHMLA